ncbi:MAG TPA: branched-chain amino acid transaminase [candidate division Zixibacteria bacterium]|nr:branched-chain amino acid transaminase [candidate division Zixibacteria bacterium]
MAFTKTKYIWMNGKLVAWDDAKIHVLSHVVHYGSSVFEGMRTYITPKGTACFRLRDHSKRLINSAKIYRMDIPFTADQIDQAILDLIGVNEIDSCYVRPVAYRGYESLGVDPTPCPVDLAIAAWPWGAYLGPEALEKGVSICFSTWHRLAPNTMPTLAKCGANYMNSQLIKLEAIRHGYSEGLALDVHGYVSEGSAQNFFLVRDGVIYTPPLTAAILGGITRDSVITIARDLDYEVVETNIAREQCYMADETFFTGSAVEITPISQIDQITIGEGVAGPITRKLQQAFFDLVEGRSEDKHGWLTIVPKYKGA